MSDKNDKDKAGKINTIGKTNSTSQIHSTNAINEVEATKKTSAVQKISGVNFNSPSRKTVYMSASERAEIFKLIEEEASKLLKDSPDEQKSIIEQAVKMAIDGGILEDEN